MTYYFVVDGKIQTSCNTPDYTVINYTNPLLIRCVKDKEVRYKLTYYIFDPLYEEPELHIDHHTHFIDNKQFKAILDCICEYIQKADLDNEEFLHLLSLVTNRCEEIYNMHSMMKSTLNTDLVSSAKSPN